MDSVLEPNDYGEWRWCQVESITSEQIGVSREFPILSRLFFPLAQWSSGTKEPLEGLDLLWKADDLPVPHLLRTAAWEVWA